MSVVVGFSFSLLTLFGSWTIVLMCFGEKNYSSDSSSFPKSLWYNLPRSMLEACHFVMQKIGYRLNLRERQCTRFNLTESFHPIEVPPEATFFGSFYVGSSAAEGAGVLVNAWGGQTERGKQHVPDYYVATFTNSVLICLPFL